MCVAVKQTAIKGISGKVWDRYSLETPLLLIHNITVKYTNPIHTYVFLYICIYNNSNNNDSRYISILNLQQCFSIVELHKQLRSRNQPILLGSIMLTNVMLTWTISFLKECSLGKLTCTPRSNADTTILVVPSLGHWV